MKIHHLSALAVATVIASLPLSAQVFIGSDDFNDNTLTAQIVNGSTVNPIQAAGQWRRNSPASGTFTETNQRLEYTNADTSGARYGALDWSTTTSSITEVGGAGLSSGAPYTSSWFAQVELTNLTAPASGYTLVGMEISSLAIPSGNNAYYGIYLSNSQTDGNSLMVESGIWNGSYYDRTPEWFHIGDTTDVTVRATFDAATKELSFSFSTDGATFLSTGVTYDLDGAHAGPTAPLSDGLALSLIGFANGGAPAITAGEMYFDNFSVTAIPEPSTYAALAGLGALGLALWRRRQARTAA